ncbi:MAG: hypothetical protein NW237_14405 [Cyanobacteriota bacterium]|nr:hypothetical protein [Cyanobacteriota bacterium]
MLQPDIGNQIVVKIAYSLMEQITFPDLKNWEDSEDKIRDADTAAERLKALHKKQQEEIEQQISKEAQVFRVFTHSCVGAD